MKKQKKSNKENQEIRKDLINFMKNYDTKCPDCGKLFLGVILSVVYEHNMNPPDIGSEGYLSCEKCPECAKKCYNTRYEILERNRKLPCLDEKVDEYDGNIDDYLMDLRDDIECYYCLDDDCIKDSPYLLDKHNLMLEKGILIDLFDYLS